MELLCEFLLEGNKATVDEYTRYMISTIRNEAENAGDVIAAIHGYLAEIKEKLLLQIPYMDMYISFPSRCRRTGDNTEMEFCYQHVMEQMSNLTDEIRALNVCFDNDQVCAACRQILARIDEPITLQDISEQLFLNSKYLSTLIKKYTGKSGVEYLTFAKMERAKKLLRESHLKIGEIAVKLGYSDIEYFSRVFKKETRLSPTEYRRKQYVDGKYRKGETQR